MLKIIITENSNDTKVLLDGEDITDKLQIRELSLSVKAHERTHVTLECFVDRMEIEPATVEITEAEDESNEEVMGK